jgi:drug/metabolite transporter (DMT)-like permease
MLPKGRSYERWTIWVAFAALCVLVSSSWLLPFEADDGPWSLVRQSCFYGVVGLVALAGSYRSLWSSLQRSATARLRLAGVSVMLFGAPAVVRIWTQHGVSDVGQAALFALVPFVVVVAAMGREPLAGEEFAVRRFFAPALAGFGGVLLVLSFGLPVSARARVMFGAVLAVVVAVGLASAWIYRLLRGVGMAEAFAVVCLSNAIFLAACSPLSGTGWSEGAVSLVSLSSLYYLLELILLIWLLREMSPVRLAARYLVAPLLIVLEGLVLLRPDFTLRTAAGVALVVAGTGYILLSPRHNSDSPLSIR